MLLNSAVFIIFFFGGWLFPFFFKSTILFVLKIILLIFFNILLFLTSLIGLKLSIDWNSIWTVVLNVINFFNLESSTMWFNLIVFNVKTVFVAIWFIVVRAILPRYRFDQLMDLCWKKILPVSCSFFLFFIFVIYYFEGFQYTLELDLLKPKNLSIFYFTFF
jgi:NADH:ubiquinone oxidoreductase subunit H